MYISRPTRSGFIPFPSAKWIKSCQQKFEQNPFSVFLTVWLPSFKKYLKVRLHPFYKINILLELFRMWRFICHPTNRTNMKLSHETYLSFGTRSIVCYHRLLTYEVPIFSVGSYTQYKVVCWKVLKLSSFVCCPHGSTLCNGEIRGAYDKFPDFLRLGI